MNPLELARLSLEGLSVGDAFGQCFFALDDAEAATASRRLPEAPWYYTDDTEMTLSVIASLARYGRIEQDTLAADFASRYSYERAYGPSMHRTLARIREGEDWRNVANDAFGGQGSWGNGAAMRAAPIGAFFAHDLDVVREEARRSAVVTHAHDEAVAGAIAVALGAALWARCGVDGRCPKGDEFLGEVASRVPESEVRSRLQRAISIGSTATPGFAVSALGNGTDMSAPDTVPFALWCCAHAGDSYPGAMWLAVSAGGDRDTLCAIVGGIVALRVGVAGIPSSWIACRESLPVV